MSTLLDVLETLNKTPEHRACLGLKNMHTLFPNLELPSQKPFMIHVAGTNGKGSTAYYLYQLFKKKFDTISLYSSPHLVAITERFLMFSQGKDRFISEKKFVSLYKKILRLSEKLKLTLSYFETITAMAFLWIFKESSVEMSLWEVGLGGRLDATNVLDADDSIITNIGLDHQDTLGETKAEILKEKSGIVKKGQTVFSGIQDPSLRERLLSIAHKRGATVHFVNFDQNMGVLEKNYRLAETVFNKYSFVQFHKTWQEFSKLPGRMEWISEKICLDGAHNLDGMKALSLEIQKIKGSVTLLLAITQEKNYKIMLDSILPYVDECVLLEKCYDRQMDTSLLFEHCVLSGVFPKKVPLHALKDFFRNHKGTVFVSGSLYCLAKVKAIFL